MCFTQYNTVSLFSEIHHLKNSQMFLLVVAMIHAWMHMYTHTLVHVPCTHIHIHPHLCTTPQTLPPAAPLVSVHETGEGTNVTLTCTAVGNPPPSVTWQHDNVTFPPSTTLTSSTPPPSTTVVLELHEERTGEEYTCVAINSHAGETSIVSQSIIVRPSEQQLFLVSCILRSSV